MKKIISIFLALILCFTIATPVFADSIILDFGDVAGRPGDINVDTYISSVDLVVLRKVLLGTSDFQSKKTADANEDGKVNIADLVRLKKMMLNVELVVACYGDSITEGMAMAQGKDYPSQLNALLGENYVVKNGGDGGEKSFTIAARQGAYELFTDNEITFANGVSKVTIGDQSNNGFVSSEGQALQLTNLAGNDLSVNPITINGQQYTLKLENYQWSPDRYTCTLTRWGNTDGSLTIPKNSKVVLGSSDVSASSYLDIYYMGANGGYGNDVNKLIEQYKAMIKHHGSDKYLIIIPHWTSEYDSAFQKAFGDRAVNLRTAAIEYGLEYEGLTATETDISLMNGGKLPASLRYQNKTDDVHLNEYGYHFLAHILYERAKALMFV